MEFGGSDHRQLARTLAGFARHANIGAYIILGLGCETGQASFLTETHDLVQLDAPGAAAAPLPLMMNIQDEGGIRKTVRRHWLKIGTGVAFVLLILISTVLLAALATRLTRQRDLAEASLHASNVERGRMHVMDGNTELAERILWEECLRLGESLGPAGTCLADRGRSVGAALPHGRGSGVRRAPR